MTSHLQPQKQYIHPRHGPSLLLLPPVPPLRGSPTYISCTLRAVSALHSRRSHSTSQQPPPGCLQGSKMTSGFLSGSQQIYVTVTWMENKLLSASLGEGIFGFCSSSLSRQGWWLPVDVMLVMGRQKRNSSWIKITWEHSGVNAGTQ